MASKKSKKNVPDLKEVLHQPRIGATIEPVEGADIKRVRIPIEEIDFFEDNPRTRENEQYEEIKESIRQDGLHNELDVTQRPGSDRFVLDRGGNTRLRALKELVEEGEERFREIWVRVHPYVSETVIQTRHLVENNTRSEMSFWDNAKAHMKLWRAIEEEEGKKIAARNLAEKFAERGLVIQSKSQLYLYDFATQKLEGLGAAAEHLSMLATKQFQPFFNNVLKKFLGAWPLEEEDADELINRWLAEYGKEVIAMIAPEITFQAMERFFYEKLHELTSLDKREVGLYVKYLSHFDKHEVRLKMIRVEPDTPAESESATGENATAPAAEHAADTAGEIAASNAAVDVTSGGQAEDAADPDEDPYITMRRNAWEYTEKTRWKLGKPPHVIWRNDVIVPLPSPELRYEPVIHQAKESLYGDMPFEYKVLDIPSITTKDARKRVQEAASKTAYAAGLERYIRFYDQGFGFYLEPYYISKKFTQGIDWLPKLMQRPQFLWWLTMTQTSLQHARPRALQIPEDSEFMLWHEAVQSRDTGLIEGNEESEKLINLYNIWHQIQEHGFWNNMMSNFVGMAHLSVIRWMRSYDQNLEHPNFHVPTTAHTRLLHSMIDLVAVDSSLNDAIWSFGADGYDRERDETWSKFPGEV